MDAMVPHADGRNERFWEILYEASTKARFVRPSLTAGSTMLRSPGFQGTFRWKFMNIPASFCASRSLEISRPHEYDRRKSPFNAHLLPNDL
jgi:hypothetical protein